MSSTKPPAGKLSHSEILAQPKSWDESLESLASGQLTKVCAQFSLRPDWLFIGCGTSYYIAQAMASCWTALTGTRGRAVPASELLLYPELVLDRPDSTQPVLISRSGTTSEILRAAEYLERERDIRTLSISCTGGTRLQELSTATLELFFADDKSTVMTRSFTCMVLGLQALAAEISSRKDFMDALRKLPALGRNVLNGLDDRIRNFVEKNEFAYYVCLAQGPLFGIAGECMLKVKEMSCSASQCFHTLEFRHGPKSVVRPETLITFLLSETSYDAEREVLEEVKGLGGTTLVVANRADEATRRAADFLVELNLDMMEFARPIVYTLAGQLLGLYTGLKKGIDPDSPPHLSRSVLLEEKS